MLASDYLKKLEERGKTNRISREFQMTALEIAEVLDDKKHISLYMKLAKTHPKQMLMRVAKSVAERRHIEHKGAYFMKILKEEGYFSSTSKVENKKNRSTKKG